MKQTSKTLASCAKEQKNAPDKSIKLSRISLKKTACVLAECESPPAKKEAIDISLPKQQHNTQSAIGPQLKSCLFFPCVCVLKTWTFGDELTFSKFVLHNIP